MKAQRDKIDIVFYHGDCPDGATAAWVASTVNPNARLIPADYGMRRPSVKGLNVAILDFSWPREDILFMIERANSLIVLDHHETAVRNLSGIDEVIVVSDHSGAGLAWSWFRPDDEPHWLVKYVEDGDLHRFVLPLSRTVSAYMRLHSPYTPDAIKNIAESVTLDQAMLEGSVAKKSLDGYIAATKQFAEYIKFHGYNAMIANATRWGISDLANEICRAPGTDIGIVWFYDHAAGCVRVSLRSKTPDVDVRALAELHGGGGHTCAAAFKLRSPADIDRLCKGELV